MTAQVRLPAVDVGDVVTICTDSTSPARWTVHDGVAPPEIVPPFVAVFPLPMINDAMGLAAECWGTLDAVFQVSCFGESVDQADKLARLIITQTGWTGEWVLDDIASPVSEDVPVPSWVFVPLTFRHHG